MDFGKAIEALKDGHKVTRKGWNGNKPTVIPDYPNYTPTDRVEYKEEYANMYLWLKPATTIKSEWCKDPMLKEIVDANGGEAEALGTICMKTADNKILTGWLASQSDMLSNDWEIL